MKLANAPCSWGVLEFNLSGKAAKYDQVLDEIQQTGYVGTELGDWGFMPTEPSRLKDELRRRDLELIAAFVPVDFSDLKAHVIGEGIALRTAELLAEVAGEDPIIVLADDNGKDPIRTKYAGRILPQHSLSQKQWMVFAEGVNQIAHSIRKEVGLRTVFHHHCAGYVETEDEIEKLLSLTDPDLVGLCFDTGHYRFGGGDALIGLQRHGDRIWHLHFKDCHPEVAAQSRSEGWDYFESVKNGVFCELGKGEIDFPAIVSRLKNLGYDGWVVVEQDVYPGMGTPEESALRNRNYLKSLGL